MPERTPGIIQRLANEQGRVSAIVHAVSGLYSQNLHYTRVVEEMSNSYGFKFYTIQAKKAEDFQSELVKYLAMGYPALIRFDVASDMSQTPYVMVDHSDGKEFDCQISWGQTPPWFSLQPGAPPI